MGIPVGWNIVRDEAKEKDVLRADVIGSRSPIRRRARSSRPPRQMQRQLSAFSRLGYGDAASLPSPRLSHPPLAPPVPELRAHDLERARARDLDLDLDLDREDPPRLSSSGSGNGNDNAHAREAADEPSPPARTPGFAPAERFREIFGRLADDGSRGSPPPVPGWVFDSPPRLRDSPPRPASGRRIELDGPAEAAPLLPTLTSTGPSRRPSTYRPPQSQPQYYIENDEDDDDEDDDAPHATNAVSHPPLRRVGHRRIANGPLPSSSLRESWSPVSPVDGLGDRERSNSVSSTSSTNLPWQTFLHTVVPDPVPPTAESSFASSAASASFAASSSRASSSNSNSAASLLTHVTVPSRRPSAGAVRRRGEELSGTLARACESSDEGDSTASDTDEEAATNTLSRRRMRPSYFADEPPSPRRYGRSVMEQGLDARRYIRSYYSHERTPDPFSTLWQTDGPPRSPEPQGEEGPRQEADSFATTVVDDDAPPSTAGLASPLDQELRDARNILERLARRGDVGDDFWASVGLTRSFADGVERVQERGRF
ncbi:hypothetical protein B5807_03590 [Epicoccum nigrum]|uniref:Uncharacterized protein n=1 Tax=Epicoccum nigrum TaxID=105696 RepID=A0A1Y2M5Z7_EPING|nr:hypothetical protein B5807_03590 [Epicoccum nigrum]